MDIDDLLAEVSVDATAEETRDWQELTRCWVAERVAPALLPWPSALLERVLDRIRRQVCNQCVCCVCCFVVLLFLLFCRFVVLLFLLLFSYRLPKPKGLMAQAD